MDLFSWDIFWWSNCKIESFSYVYKYKDKSPQPKIKIKQA